MKLLTGPLFDKNRIPAPKAYVERFNLTEKEAMGNGYNGFFLYRVPNDTAFLRVVASSGDGWDHVSVSLEHRCPTWAEMDWVKRLFFKDNEVAFQLHPKPSDHINIHPYTLHLWRPLNRNIPLPPAHLV
jgi:hypothetical protein